MSQKIIGDAWESYQDELLQNAGTIQRVETRKAFYAGAIACHAGVLGKISDDVEPTAEDVDVIKGLVAEFAEFAEFAAEMKALAEQVNETAN